MGALDTRSFVDQFYFEAIGSAADLWFSDMFTGRIDTGAMTRTEYMVGVVSNLNVRDSYVYQMPDGAAFSNPWIA